MSFLEVILEAIPELNTCTQNPQNPNFGHKKMTFGDIGDFGARLEPQKTSLEGIPIVEPSPRISPHELAHAKRMILHCPERGEQVHCWHCSHCKNKSCTAWRHLHSFVSLYAKWGKPNSAYLAEELLAAGEVLQ